MGKNINILELIYDTLFINKQYEQFDISKVNDSCIDYKNETISFDYNGKLYMLNLVEITDSTF